MLSKSKRKEKMKVITKEKKMMAVRANPRLKDKLMKAKMIIDITGTK